METIIVCQFRGRRSASDVMAGCPRWQESLDDKK